MKPPRDLSRSRAGNVQLAMTVRRDVAALIHETAAARGQTIVSLVEASVRAYCGGSPDATQETDRS
jgi:hypothetical protein